MHAVQIKLRCRSKNLPFSDVTLVVNTDIVQGRMLCYGTLMLHEGLATLKFRTLISASILKLITVKYEKLLKIYNVMQLCNEVNSEVI